MADVPGRTVALVVRRRPPGVALAGVGAFRLLTVALGPPGRPRPVEVDILPPTEVGGGRGPTVVVDAADVVTPADAPLGAASEVPFARPGGVRPCPAAFLATGGPRTEVPDTQEAGTLAAVTCPAPVVGAGVVADAEVVRVPAFHTPRQDGGGEIAGVPYRHVDDAVLEAVLVAVATGL